MRGQIARALGALLVAGAVLAVLAPAAGATTGDQTFKGTIVTSGTSGDRVVVNSEVVAKGVVKGKGEIVEVDNLPGDPDNLFRDDFVFKNGTMHVLTTNLDFSFSFDPRSCHFEATLVQTAEIAGGTGSYANASGTFDSTVNGKGELARNPDGSCSMDLTPLHEVDKLEARGTLTN